MINTKKYDLKHKVIENIFKSISKNPQFREINYKNFKKISSFEKTKFLILSKNLSKYLYETKTYKISDDTLILMIQKFICNKKNIKIYKKNIERIKFYILLFNDKTCSHLIHYMFNNYNIYNVDKSQNFTSIVIKKEKHFSVILNEYLDISIKPYCKKKEGEIFLDKPHVLFSNIKYKIYLFIFSIIITQIFIFNIPNNYVILEMNLVVHMKLNNSGRIISFKPKTKSASNMIKNTKQLKKKISTAIPDFINYSLENNILKPGEKVKIYILGPPLNKKSCENLKNLLEYTPINVIINNSGNLIKINTS